MSLWKNKEENEKKIEIQTEKDELDKLEGEKNLLMQKVEKYINELSHDPGILVKVEGAGFGRKNKYKFKVDDDNYILTQYYEKNDCIISTASLDLEEKIKSYKEALEFYKNILNTKPIYLKKSEYYGKDLPLESQPQKSELYVGEIEQQIGSIKFALNNNVQEDILITINNLNQDLSMLGDLKQTIHLKNFYNILDIPEESFQVTIVNGNDFCQEDTYHVFREQDNLLFVRVKIDSYYGKDKIIIIRVKLNDILYYRSEGSIRYEQQISGGGGMGINYGSAIIGGLLFGGTGAIIGSRRNEEISEIESKTITYDDRIVTLVIRKEGRIFQIGFNVNDELAFDWLIPEKQYDYVIQKRREKFEK